MAVKRNTHSIFWEIHCMIKNKMDLNVIAAGEYTYHRVLRGVSEENLWYYNWLSQWSLFLKKLMVAQLLKKFPKYCGTRLFIAVFTEGRH
jgi:hypothetical protein